LAEAANSRADMLKAIREAEVEGGRREERARAKTAQVKASTQTECSRLIEQAEKDGRVAMRKAVEDARKELGVVREERLRLSERQSQSAEAAALERMPKVSEFIYSKFAREHDVKD